MFEDSIIDHLNGTKHRTKVGLHGPWPKYRPGGKLQMGPGKLIIIYYYHYNLYPIIDRHVCNLSSG